MRRWMVMMAASAAALVAAGPARAVEQKDGATAVDVKIADDLRSGAGQFSGAEYAKSDRFGRAWLVLHYRYQAPCRDADGECELDSPLEVSVPGLTYDAASKQVVYERSGDEPVACAKVRSGGFLRPGGSLAETGKCNVRLVEVDRLLDDGFAGRKDRREEVHFAVRP